MAMTGHVPLDHLKIVLGATKIPRATEHAM